MVLLLIFHGSCRSPISICCHFGLHIVDLPTTETRIMRATTAAKTNHHFKLLMHIFLLTFLALFLKLYDDSSSRSDVSWSLWISAPRASVSVRFCFMIPTVSVIFCQNYRGQQTWAAHFARMRHGSACSVSHSKCAYCEILYMLV